MVDFPAIDMLVFGDFSVKKIRWDLQVDVGSRAQGLLKRFFTEKTEPVKNAPGRCIHEFVYYLSSI